MCKAIFIYICLHPTPWQQAPDAGSQRGDVTGQLAEVTSAPPPAGSGRQGRSLQTQVDIDWVARGGKGEVSHLTEVRRGLSQM